MSINKHTHKNTYYITNEIDYDKLAKAIVSAQEQQNPVQEESAVATPFAILCSTLFLLSSIFMGMIATAFASIPWAAYSGHYSLYFERLPISFVVVIILSMISYFFCFLLWKAYKAMSVEKDKGFIISIFSGMASFAALIVAAFTLFYTINPQ